MSETKLWKGKRSCITEHHTQPQIQCQNKVRIAQQKEKPIRVHSTGNFTDPAAIKYTDALMLMRTKQQMVSQEMRLSTHYGHY